MNSTQAIEMIQNQGAVFVRLMRNGQMIGEGLKHDSFKKGYRKLSSVTASSVNTKLKLYMQPVVRLEIGE